MDIRILIAVIAVFLFLGIFGLGSVLASKLSGLDERVQRLRREGEEVPTGWRGAFVQVQGLFRQLGTMIPRSAEEMSRQELRLVRAGIRRQDGAILLVGAQAALAVALAIGFVVSGLMMTNPFLYAVLSVLFGAMIPDLWLSSAISRRKDRIQRALPDALDLQVVCVEAGLGLDQSLLRVGAEIRSNHRDLSDEFRLLTLELNAGKSRADSLRNLAARADVDDLRALVAVLIQTDRFGTSIADSLRVFSDSLRTKRRQRAEEHAAKMSVKMIPPLFLFILPATFAVVVGPAIIAIANGLLPFLQGSTQ